MRKNLGLVGLSPIIAGLCPQKDVMELNEEMQDPF